MYSSRTRMVGMSGLDTVSIVTQLMQAESYRYTALQKQHQILLWQQEKYRAAAKSIQDFSNKFLSLSSPMSIRMSSSFGNFAATVGGTNATTGDKATVRTTSNAKEGTYNLEIKQLATKASVSADADFGNKIVGQAGGFTVANLQNLKEGDSFIFDLNGIRREIKIGSGPGELDLADPRTRQDFTGKLQALLNEKFGRDDFRVQGIGAGAEARLNISVGNGGHELTVYNGSRTVNSVTASGANADWSGGKTVSAADAKDYYFTIGTANLKVTLEEDDTIEKIRDKINAAINAAKDADDNDNTARTSGVSASVAEGKLVFTNSSGNAERTVAAGATDDLLAFVGFSSTVELRRSSVLSEIGLTNGASTLNAANRTMGDLFDFNGHSEITITSLTNLDNGKINGGDGITIKADETLQTFINRINNSDAGVTVKYDSLSGKFIMEAKSEGNINGFTTVNFTTSATGVNADFFGFSGETVNLAKNAVFSINGIETDRQSNNFIFEGLNITLNDVTEGYGTAAAEKITISVAKDNSKTIELIKEFVAGYNALIEQLNAEITATRPRNGKYSYYEPLTSDEKKAMSDREIELWEEKAKEGLLSRDSVLTAFTSSMRQAYWTNVIMPDGRELNFSQLGITTGPEYWEGGKLVIDEQKLSEALDKYGEDIISLFTSDTDAKSRTGNGKGIAERLNTVVEQTIGRYTNSQGKLVDGSLVQKAGVEFLPTSMTSNDMYYRIKEQETRLADMLVWLGKKEDEYYAMFSRVEEAMMRAQSQMEYMMQQMGMYY